MFIARVLSFALASGISGGQVGHACVWHAVYGPVLAVPDESLPRPFSGPMGPFLIQGGRPCIIAVSHVLLLPAGWLTAFLSSFIVPGGPSGTCVFPWGFGSHLGYICWFVVCHCSCSVFLFLLGEKASTAHREDFQSLAWKQNLHFSAVYVPGELDQWVNSFSQDQPSSIKWSFLPVVFQFLCERWGAQRWI